MKRLKFLQFWPVAAGILLITTVLLSITFSSSSATTTITIVFTGLSGILAGLFLLNRYLKYHQLLRELTALTTQFSNINQGLSTRLELKTEHRQLTDLVTQLDAHLALETERLVQEQNFSADASHELRTPLAGMRLQAQVAQRTTDPQQRDKALNNIMLAIDRSTRLIEQLLVFSRLTRRRNIAENASEDLLALFHKQLLKHSQVIKRQSITVITNLDEVHLPKITMHRDQFTALLDNLIINSLNHCPEKGQVRFLIENNNRNLTLSFEDSGKGIDDKDLAKVLIPFQKSSDGKQKSSGLGLAIAHRVATLHSGHLSLSRSQLGGLKVTVVLDLQPDA